MEKKKDELEDNFYGTLKYGPQSGDASGVKKSAYRKPAMHFPGVEYDEAGKFLVLHHYNAAYYYKINVAVLLFFFGVTLYSYVNAPHVFFGQEWLANLYLFALQGGIL